MTEPRALDGSGDVIACYSLDGARARIDVLEDARELYAEQAALRQELVAAEFRLTEAFRQGRMRLCKATRTRFGTDGTSVAAPALRQDLKIGSCRSSLFPSLSPLRGRLEALARLCDSIRVHTSHADQLEIVFVMDSDDQPSLQFEYAGLNIRKVEVAPGMSMSELNAAGYSVSNGRYLMLLNDDVVLHTPAWDDRVLEIFRGYPDGMVLVHVNENLFREKLCTFPFLTRTFCDLAGGICPERLFALSN